MSLMIELQGFWLFENKVRNMQPSADNSVHIIPISYETQTSDLQVLRTNYQGREWSFCKKFVVISGTIFIIGYSSLIGEYFFCMTQNHLLQQSSRLSNRNCTIISKLIKIGGGMIMFGGFLKYVFSRRCEEVNELDYDSESEDF